MRVSDFKSTCICIIFQLNGAYEGSLSFNYFIDFIHLSIYDMFFFSDLERAFGAQRAPLLGRQIQHQPTTRDLHERR